MPSGRFCYLCGESESELVEGLCSVCFSKEKKPFPTVKDLTSQICRVCSSYKAGDWKNSPEDLEDILKTLAHIEAQNLILSDSETRIEDVRITDIKESRKSVAADLELKVGFDEINRRSQDFIQLNLTLNKVLCPVCSRRSGGYYEALIQIRSTSPERLLRDVHEILGGLYKKDRMAYIAEESIVRGGVDIKLGSSRAAKKLVSYFKKKWNAEIKESATLIGRKEGKGIYRKTMLIRVK